VKTKEFNKEVLYSVDTIVKVKDADIKRLKDQSGSNERKRIRLCAHRDVIDPVHEMLIIHTRDTYVRPHKHLNKTESYHIIEGTADIVIYDEMGVITDIINMGVYGTGMIFFYRINDPLYHTLRITSDYFVFHETTNGPFDKADTIWAPWAPQDNDHGLVDKFMKDLTWKISSTNKL